MKTTTLFCVRDRLCRLSLSSLSLSRSRLLYHQRPFASARASVHVALLTHLTYRGKKIAKGGVVVAVADVDV